MNPLTKLEWPPDRFHRRFPFFHPLRTRSQEPPDHHDSAHRRHPREDTFLDGQLRAVQGDGVIAEFYDYGVDKEDGHRRTLTRVAKADGPRWSRSRVNALGQSIQSERPSPVAGYALVSGYDEQGLLLYSGQPWSKNSQAGGADGSSSAPTGRDIPAQGNALGANDKNHASPEGARQPGGSPTKSLPESELSGMIGPVQRYVHDPAKRTRRVSPGVAK